MFNRHSAIQSKDIKFVLSILEEIKDDLPLVSKRSSICSLRHLSAAAELFTESRNWGLSNAPEQVGADWTEAYRQFRVATRPPRVGPTPAKDSEGHYICHADGVAICGESARVITIKSRASGEGERQWQQSIFQKSAKPLSTLRVGD